MYLPVSEDGVHDDKNHALGICSEECFGFDFLYTFLHDGSTSESQVMSDFGTEITKENDLVLLASTNIISMWSRLE